MVSPDGRLLAVVWLIYPINFFLDEQGIGVYSHPFSDAVYTIADVTAKVVYGFVLLGGILAIEKRAERAMGRSLSDMSENEKDEFEAELTRHEGDAARHKLLPVAGDAGTRSGGFGKERAENEKVYEADPEGVRVDRDDDDSVRVHRRD